MLLITLFIELFIGFIVLILTNSVENCLHISSQIISFCEQNTILVFKKY
jgi:hypothetical protein